MQTRYPNVKQQCIPKLFNPISVLHDDLFLLSNPEVDTVVIDTQTLQHFPQPSPMPTTDDLPRNATSQPHQPLLLGRVMEHSRSS